MWSLVVELCANQGNYQMITHLNVSDFSRQLKKTYIDYDLYSVGQLKSFEVAEECMKAYHTTHSDVKDHENSVKSRLCDALICFASSHSTKGPVSDLPVIP